MKQLFFATCILLAGLMTTSVMAGEKNKASKDPAKVQKEVSSEVSGVSQTAIDIVTREQQARQRRDEMLQKRQETIEAAQ